MLSTFLHESSEENPPKLDQFLHIFLKRYSTSRFISASIEPKERKVRAKTFHGGDSRRIPNILDVLPKTRGELRRRNGPKKLRRARRSAVHSKASAGLSITIQQDASMEDVSTPKQTFPFDVPSYSHDSGDSSDPILPDPSGLGMAERYRLYTTRFRK